MLVAVVFGFEFTGKDKAVGRLAAGDFAALQLPHPVRLAGGIRGAIQADLVQPGHKTVQAGAGCIKGFQRRIRCLCRCAWCSLFFGCRGRGVRGRCRRLGGGGSGRRCRGGVRGRCRGFGRRGGIPVRNIDICGFRGRRIGHGKAGNRGVGGQGRRSAAKRQRRGKQQAQPFFHFESSSSFSFS